MLLGAITSLGLGACEQAVCPDGSGNCSPNAIQADANGGADGCDNPNELSCSGVCVDTDINPNYCGSCNNTCDTGQGCSDGACVDACAGGEVLCGDDAIDGSGSRSCVNPQTNSEYCGATGTCTGAGAGESCAQDSMCVSGVCTAITTVKYIGSLPVTTGLWEYNQVRGVPGAEAACRTLFAAPAATICTQADLLVAQSQGELANPVDSGGAPVESWFSVNPASNLLQLQCIDPLLSNTNLSWTYETAHLGEGAQYVSVSTLGAISQVVNQPALAQGCSQLRNVACCNP